MVGSLCLAWATAASLESGFWFAQPVGPTSGAAHAAAEVRMTPEVLAAAGFTSVDAAELCDVLGESPTLVATLVTTRESLAEAEDAVRSLAWQTRVDPSNESLRTALANAEAAVNAARATREAAQQQAITALCEVGPSGSAAAVLAALDQRCYDNAAFLAAPRTAEQSRQLRMAEIQAQRCARLGESCPSAASQILSAASAAPGFTAAQQGLAENLAGITAILAIGQ